MHPVLARKYIHHKMYITQQGCVNRFYNSYNKEYILNIKRNMMHHQYMQDRVTQQEN